ncbi:uncharacterized protein LOC134829871 [Culicoides brevitarsis]|uniref:uncharacterized protein LOC134829871 n=1 Tax=Culicoides brevitarsis TaxID=469753 RepID=UPI00307BAE8C
MPEPKFNQVVRKSILRNTEVPINSRKTNTNDDKKQVRINSCPTPVATLHAEDQKDFNPATEKYTKHTVNSSKHLYKELKDIRSGKGFDKTEKDFISPEIAHLMRRQLTKTLNFPRHVSVFHGLCPINVNDSALELDVDRPRKIYVPRVRHEKDPEPSLGDFLEPVATFGMTCVDSDDEDNTHYAKFIDVPAVKHQPPICTTIRNVQTIQHLFD